MNEQHMQEIDKRVLGAIRKGHTMNEQHMEIDKRILAAIRKGHTKAGDIADAVSDAPAVRAAAETRVQYGERRGCARGMTRIVDHSLQRLRKAGLIRNERGHWKEVK